MLSPFHATVLFLHPLKTPENQSLFKCYQGVSEEAKDVKWVKFGSYTKFWRIDKRDSIPVEGP